ncbi:CAF1 family ribonuclease (macronuclear) [Tetrahymena thermophila SB210]|uniref:CAF1 family ribonuclease n=1 Tax=Tetrahymena thermophila (strain SB210) TaxID=312017 RepID=Q24FW1_TETTS|nr:CAF1 family ribonuclease [Tetrahymena thermophila SB210]EAS06649.3 CAF1 family ribonuclease [Tetrahymena thermophila SB210]|eukprot:XP_001026894.3 CAF1 family ribonuclease [Tetrahymena thermophila SB210]
MYQPSLNYDYQNPNPIKLDAKGLQSNNLNQQQNGQQTIQLLSTLPSNSYGVTQGKYASPFEDTKKLNQNQSQLSNHSPKNFVYQQTASKQNESYQSPQFIKSSSAALAQNFSASNNILNKNVTSNITNNNQAQNTQQNITANQNTIQQGSIIQQSNQQQLINNKPIIQQTQPQLVTYSYQPAMSYVSQTTPTNTIPIVQSYIQPVPIQVPNQNIVVQNPPNITYTTTSVPNTTQVHLVPQKTSYLIESKPILQTSQIRILSPISSNRVQTNDEDFTKPLFTNKSPYSKKYDEQRSQRWQEFSKDDSRLNQFEYNRQYNQQNEQTRQFNAYQRSVTNENNQRSTYRFEERNQFEGQQNYKNQQLYSQNVSQVAPPAFDYTNYSNQYEPAKRTAMFENNQSAPYSFLASQKIVFKEDTDLQTRKLIESRLQQDRIGQRSLDQSGFKRFQNQSLYQSNLVAQNRIDSFNIRQSYQFLNQNRDFNQNNVRFSTLSSQDAQRFYINEEALKERDLNFMFEKRPTDLVKEYMQAIIDLEREIENNRIKIVRQQDYSVQLFYEIFDANESGYIIVEEFVQGLKKLGIQAEQNDVRLLVNRYSIDKNNKIDQQEFINMVVPKTYSHIESIFVRKPYISEKNMRQDTRELMAKLMKSLLNSEIVLEQIRKKIEQKQITSAQLFTSLCDGPEDSVNKQNLRQFLVKIGVFVNREEIPQIMQHFDLRDMGFFRLQEFEAELKPRFQ